MKRELFDFFTERFPVFFNHLGREILPKSYFNININICDNNQKRVLILYSYIMEANYSYIKHANVLQATQMIHYFLSHDYCVDYCFYDDWKSYDIIKNNRYDIVIGQGMIYKQLCKSLNIPIKICILSENHPETVKLKYRERKDYFHKRHPHTSLGGGIERTDILDVEQFNYSTHGILMNSHYNAKNYTEFNSLFLVNANAIFDKDFLFNEDEICQYISKARNRILWFGSGGIIHKGLDILIDAVRKISDIDLDCYGIKMEEKKLFKRIASKNTHDCGHINVYSDKFYKEVVLKHNFMIFPSCSEGMATSVATCMAYGIIPVVTKETGYEPCDCIIQLNGYKVEDVYCEIMELLKWDDERILDTRKKCYYYAREKFDLQVFDDRFSEIMNSIL